MTQQKVISHAKDRTHVLSSPFNKRVGMISLCRDLKIWQRYLLHKVTGYMDTAARFNICRQNLCSLLNADTANQQ